MEWRSGSNTIRTFWEAIKMVSEKVTIVNSLGIHARPSGELAKVAKACASEVYLLYKDKKINPRSVLNLMAAAIHHGDEVTIQCEGDQEEEDLQLIVEAIKNGLGETVDTLEMIFK